ncbi:hypothetical protein F5884DRAFT_861989 [Xylogone sp. PMI_703]|nr:hypothetical protein F5884DRAFT_861989 [Xylogone sp. PMI_703]
MRAILVFEVSDKCFDTVTLQFSKHAPTIFTGQRLRGVLYVSHEEGYLFDAAQIVLQGDVKSTVKGPGGVVSTIEKPLIIMSCVKVAEDFQQIVAEVPHTVMTQTSFFFNIPEYMSIPSDRTGIQQTLPPSMRILKPNQFIAWDNFANGSVNSCDVSYYIRARVFRNGRQVYESSREIIIMPVTDLPPPLDPEDFKGEFRLLATWPLKSPTKQRENITLTISAEEPQPIIFPTSEGETGSTDVFLNFETGMLSMKSDEKTYVESQLTYCEVSITLNAITYFSTLEQSSAMSIEEVTRSPSVVSKKTKYKTDKRKMHLKWRKGHGIASGTAEFAKLEASVTLTTTLPHNFSRLPSFLSTLVARRYALDFDIMLGYGHGIMPKKLRLPIQIIHRPLEKCPDRLSEVEFEDSLLPPSYVP